MQLREIAARQQNRTAAMDYASDKTKHLSPNAKAAFATITTGLIQKADREGEIPKTYRFFAETNDPAISAELEAAGVITYALTDDKTGARVYDHAVDADALRSALQKRKHKTAKTPRV